MSLLVMDGLVKRYGEATVFENVHLTQRSYK